MILILIYKSFLLDKFFGNCFASGYDVFIRMFCFLSAHIYINNLCGLCLVVNMDKPMLFKRNITMLWTP